MPVDAQPATSFVIDLDLAGMLVGLGIDCGAPEDQDAVFAAEQEALARCPVPPAAVPGRGCEVLPTGAGLAAWLESAVPDRCAGADLPDIACAYRRLASWAQAQELAAVAEIAARTAARRGRGDDDPWVVPEAAAQVGLALTMSQPTAAEWTCLGTRLRRQLTGTAGALSAGQIDLTRARLIAEATVALPDETARAVEARVLAAAGEQTSGQLRASLRRAVIAADPDGADRRRERAERHARVSLYPDADGTATLTGAGLPAVTAAAAMARITAMARAMKTAGQSGGLDYLRAYVMLGLLLGTLPLIPPPPGAPPDEPPPDEPPPDEPPPDEPPDRAPPDDAGGQPASPDPDLPPPPDEPPDLHDPEPAASGAESRDPGDSDEAISPGVAPPAWPPLPAGLPGPVRYPSAGEASGRAPPGLLDVLLPWSALIGAARAEPAVLGRIGPVTPHQKRQLVDLAASHPGTQWRVILTDDDGHAQGVERLRLPGSGSSLRAGPGNGAPVIGRITVTIPDRVVGCQPCATGPAARGASRGDPAGPHTDGSDALAAALLRAAARAADRARAARAANQAAAGCAHHSATAVYRPSPRLRELVVARDLTCTFPPCGQPAWNADLDHTVAWQRGGPTCNCNLGGRCRTHHKIKQLPGWKLEQSQAGIFRWTTPAGHSYLVQPYRYPV